MANYHILTGDALAETFMQSGIEGNIIVAREALIDGPVSADEPELFWKHRSEFIGSDTKPEFDKINNIQPDDEVNLWFENDLFCQANMWFSISLINKNKLTNVFRVTPLINKENKWAGFGRHTPNDLLECYDKHKSFTKGDFTLGENLWDAYRKSDIIALNFLSGSLSPCFPFLEEVCRAEMERKRNARPRKVLEDLLAQGYTDFKDIFRQFSQREGIYGYGDSQIESMLKEISNL